MLFNISIIKSYKQVFGSEITNVNTLRLSSITPNKTDVIKSGVGFGTDLM